MKKDYFDEKVKELRKVQHDPMGLSNDWVQKQVNILLELIEKLVEKKEKQQ